MKPASKLLSILVAFICFVCNTAEALTPYLKYGNHFLDGNSLVILKDLSTAPGYSQCVYTSALQDKKGFIWLGSWDGLKRFDGHEFVTFKAHAGDNSPLKSNRFNDIWEADDDHIVCRYNDTYYLFDKRTHTFSLSRHSSRLHSSKKYSGMKPAVDSLFGKAGKGSYILLVDRQEGLWVYSHKGLYRMVRKPLNYNLTKDGNEEEEFVRALFMDSDHRIWRSDKNGYVKIMDRRLNTLGWLSPSGQVSRSRVAFGHSVYCFFEDSHHRMWLGSKPDGLFMLTPEDNSYAVTHFRHDDSNPWSLSFDAVYTIVEDRWGRLWIGTIGGGINMMSPDALGRFYNAGNTASLRATSQRVRTLLVRGDVLLAGSDIGLYSSDISRPLGRLHFYHNVRRSKDHNSLNSGNIFQLMTARDGSIWLAAYGGGISRIASSDLLTDNIRLQNFSVGDGMLSDISIALVEDIYRKMWAVSEDAIDAISPKSHGAHVFGKRFHNLGFLFTDVAPLSLDDGRILMGTTQGLFDFYPDDMSGSSFVPPLVIYGARKITLPSSQHRLSLKVAALDYDAGDGDIVYAYRMDGVDEDWNYTTENIITYPNVPSGTHVLHVKSTNGDGVWVSNEQRVTIHRSPSFRESVWAPVLISLLTIAILAGLYLLFRYVMRLKHNMTQAEQAANDKIEHISANMRQLIADKSSAPIIEKVDDRRSRFGTKAIQTVMDNIENGDFDVDDFAKAMGMSRNVLYQKMKEEFNITPMSFVQKTRMEQACKLMRDTDMTISQVSFQCGFASPKYFSRCFKQYTGLTPKDYRKKEDRENKE